MKAREFVLGDKGTEIILGSLLGDGCIPKRTGRAKSFTLSWEHSLKQEEYAIWKAEKSKIEYNIYKRSRLDKRTNKTYHSITVYSTGIDFKEFRNLIYPLGIKIAPKKVLDMLTPLSIAVWFCDDGSMYYNGNNCHLSLGINYFKNKKEIIDYFKKRWGLNFKLSCGAIRLTSIKEVDKFERLFSKYYPPMMEYKKLSFNKKKYDKTLTDKQKNYRNKKYK